MAGRWEARIGVPSSRLRPTGRHVYLGLFASEADAAKARRLRCVTIAHGTVGCLHRGALLVGPKGHTACSEPRFALKNETLE